MPFYQRPKIPTVPRQCRPASVYATHWDGLKKCSDLAFGRSQRLFSASGDSVYSVSPSSVSISKWNGIPALTASLVSGKDTVPSLKLAIIPYAHGIARIIVDDAEPLEYNRHNASGVIESDAAPEALSDGLLSVSDIDATYMLKDSSVRLRVMFDPFSINLEDPISDQVMTSINAASRLRVEDFTDSQGAMTGPETFRTFTDSRVSGPESIGVDISFPASSYLHGLPERTCSFDLPDTIAADGTILTDPLRLYNLDIPFYEPDSVMGLYGAVPLVIARNDNFTTAAFWHNTSETYIDIQSPTSGGKSTHWFSESGLLDIFLLPGPTNNDVFKQYLYLTGAPAMQQRFVLGYHQCRYSYVDEHDVRTVDAGFDERSIPYDVMWLDIDHTDGKKYFTWDKSKYPDPQRLIDHIVSKGRKVVTIVDPHIKTDDQYEVHARASAGGMYVRESDNCSPFVGDCWPGKSSYFDYTNESASRLWSDQFNPERYPHFSSNVHIWNDMNEPSVFDGPERTFQKDLLHEKGVEHRHVHNVYGHLMIKSTHAGMSAGHGDNSRPFILTRSFFAGSQRYAAVWTGDNTADWGHLRTSIKMLLSLQLCGIVLSGADVGGFFGNPDGELLTRWYQAGAFQTFFRGHSNADTLRREPWLLGEPFTTHIAEAIRTRYEYVPYWYTLLAGSSIGKACGFGEKDVAPPMRPLWWEFPNVAAMTNETQWMVGNALLVAPVLHAGAAKHIIDVPEGSTWYDVTDPEAAGRKVSTHGKVEFDANLGRQFVLQRGGTVVPKIERGVTSTECGAGEKGLSIVVALDEGRCAEGKVYVDDGKSLNFRRGLFMLGMIRMEDGVLTSKIVSGSPRGFEASDGAVIGKVTVLGSGAVTNVLVDDKDVSFERDEKTGVAVVDGVKLGVGGDWRMSFKYSRG